MRRHLLIACYETPGYGGASTATYALFERMQADGFPVSYLNLVDDTIEPFLRSTFGPEFANPRGLARVHTHVLERRFHDRQPALAKKVAAIAPDVILAIGYIAALAVRGVAGAIPLIFFTTGCDQIDRYLDLHGDAQGVCDALRAVDQPVLFHALERRAVDGADLIVTHSTLVQALYRIFYPAALGKVYPDVIWMAEWIYGEAAQHRVLAREFVDRDIDLLFVASRWDRPEKNLPMALGIIEACPELTSHVVGLLPYPAPPPATTHGLLTSRAELFALMGRAKTVVSPSRWDAAPGILFEAAALGCNIVASRNCGNWRVCHDDLVVRDYTLAAFIDRARQACGDAYYRSRIDDYLALGDYTTLVDVVEVV